MVDQTISSGCLAVKLRQKARIPPDHPAATRGPFRGPLA
jgi:hypothetical protein